MSWKKSASFLLLGYLFVLANAGSWVSSPVTRGNQATSLKGCTGPACYGPCEVPLASINSANVQTASRGQTITVRWPRNGKAGGFVRFAWATTDKSDTMKEFDTHVQIIHCFELNCGPADPANPNGGDNGAVCSATITIPTDLTDGSWTMQWAYFGGAFVGGDYYSCVDFSVSGGSNITSRQRAIFQGGDYSNPTNRTACKYFNNDELHICVDEPCLSPPAKYAGQRNGIPAVIETPPSGETPCSYNSDCGSDICRNDGYCEKKPSLMTAGAIAAVVFAALVLLVAILVILFFIVNKKEVPYMVPFKGRL